MYGLIYLFVSERNLFGVTLLDEEDEIVAHGSFTHYPNHLQKFSRAYDSAEWEPFLRAHFEHHPQQGGARSKQQSQEQKRSSVSGSTGSMTGRAADEGGPRIDVNMATALNSMFLHLFVSRPELEAAALREAIHTLFAAVPDVHFLFLIVPIEANLREPCIIFKCLLSKNISTRLFLWKYGLRNAFIKTLINFITFINSQPLPRPPRSNGSPVQR